ncbi:MAG: hypothetical protein DWB42_05500 [Chloroflexi bacterium]|nr:hypothetical protein [Chloroflexota bacterium]
MRAKKQVSGIGLLLAALAVVVALGAVLPVFAQGLTADTSDIDEGDLEIVIGPVEFGPNGEILVNGVVIAPASGFNPSTLEAGEIVIVTGILLPSGTLQATSLEPFDSDEEPPEVTPEPTAEITPEPTAELTPEPTLEVTPEVTPEATPETTPEAISCGYAFHPVLWEAAQAFGVSYEELVAMHCAGNGVGNIIRALALAQAMNDGTTALDLLNRHKSGEGWGAIRKEADVHPSALAPGQLKKMTPTPAAGDAGAIRGGSENGGGNGNGADKDKEEKDNKGRGREDNPGNSGERGNGGNNGNNGNNGNPGGKGKK